VVVQEAADVSVTATPLNYGQELGWLLTIHNAGPTSASDTVVTLTLPAGTAFAGDVQPVQSGHCEISGRIATCALGTLKASATITIGANIVAESAGTYTLQADAQSPSPDPNLANNHAESTVTAKSASQLPPSQPGPTGTGCACTIGRSGRAIGLPLVLTVLALAALTRRRAG
jgi:uncharacterized repeat protein (TIGR01451 family)